MCPKYLFQASWLFVDFLIKDLCALLVDIRNKLPKCAGHLIKAIVILHFAKSKILCFMSDWNNWIEFYQRGFYIPFLYILSAIAAFFVGIKFHRTDLIGKVLLAYLLSDLILLIIIDYFCFFSKLPHHQTIKISYTINILICFVELNVYIFFFKNILQSKNIINIFKYLQVIFLFASIIYVVNLIDSVSFIPVRKFFHYISMLELSILLIPCFTFFIELFSKYSNELLSNRPSFWITTGIFLYASLSIPFYSVSNLIISLKVKHYYEITAVFFYIPLAFNYILLTKAFLCRKPLTI